MADMRDSVPWRVANTIVSATGLFCSLSIICQLAPLRPWSREKPRLRCFLVLQIAVIDFLFSTVTLFVCIIIMAGEPRESNMCFVLGPALSFLFFMLYACIANLAHYSLLRLHRRDQICRAVLLTRYTWISVALSVLLTAGVTASMLVREQRWTLAYGMCDVPQGLALYFIQISGRVCEVYIVFVFINMALKARAHHAPHVVWRQQRVSSGYIVVAVLQGVNWWAPWLVWQIDGQGNGDVEQLEFVIGLAWPIGNFCVFRCVSWLDQWGDIEQQRSPGRGQAVGIKAVGFAAVDSDGRDRRSIEGKSNMQWRSDEERRIVVKRTELQTRLIMCVESIVPETPTREAQRFPGKVMLHLTRSGGDIERLLNEHAAGSGELKGIIVELWEETYGRRLSVEEMGCGNVCQENAELGGAGVDMYGSPLLSWEFNSDSGGSDFVDSDTEIGEGEPSYLAYA